MSTVLELQERRKKGVLEAIQLKTEIETLNDLTFYINQKVTELIKKLEEVEMDIELL